MKVHVHGPDGVRTLDLGRTRVRTCDCPGCGGTCGGAHHRLAVKDSTLGVGQTIVADGRVVSVNGGVADIELSNIRAV